MSALKFWKMTTATAIFVCLAVFLFACGKGAGDATTTEATVPSPWSEAQIFTLPDEPETSAAAEKTEDAQEQTALRRIETARAVYGLFLESRPQFDRTDSIEVEDGMSAFRVTDPKLDTMEKLRAYLSGFFSERITQQLLNIGLYTENDGKLYALDVGMQTSVGGEKQVEVTEKTDSAEHYRLTIRSGAETSTYDFDYEKQADGKWVFTHFESY